MRKFALSVLLACAATVAQAAQPATSPLGTWQNPKRSVTVRIAMCGEELCGRIIAVTAEAEADARDAGVTNLIGTELLRGYRPSGDRRWAGTVFVPDMGRSFSSRIVEVEPNKLRISGCLIGGFLCKSQDWTRL